MVVLRKNVGELNKEKMPKASIAVNEIKDTLSKAGSSILNVSKAFLKEIDDILTKLHAVHEVLVSKYI